MDVNRSVSKEPCDGEEKGGRTVHSGGGHVLFDLRHCHLNHLNKFALHENTVRLARRSRRESKSRFQGQYASSVFLISIGLDADPDTGPATEQQCGS